MNRFKRGLAILLSTCMIGGMMPLPASAEETVSENIVQTECIENTENLENAPSEDEKSSETDHETGSETESETETDAETEGTAISAIQALIDALPDADSITEDNVENVTSQLDTIDEAKAELSDADISQLDLTRYDAAINKVMVLMGMKEENDSEIAVQANDSAGKTEQQSTDEAIVYQPAVETTDKYDIDYDGTKDTVYEISNAGQLYWFAGLVNGTLDGVEQNTLANAILTANITVNENLLDSLQYDTEGNVSNGSDFITWTPIADWMGNRTTQYSGTFDGNNKTVSGLYFNGDSTCIGLFGSSESDGNIKNVGVVDSYFKGNDHVGGVCGNNAGTITNCYNAGNLTAIEPSATIGGICGYNNGGTVTNCYNTGTVTATGSVASVGGVCGCSTAPISNCYNIGTVTATSSSADISGICGYNFGPIKNCYYLADTEDENGGKTTEQFASGEVAYLLSQGCSTGVGDDAETYDGSIWGQKLGENGDTYPVLDITKRVYQVDKYDGCEGKPGSSTKVYSNQNTSIYEEHKYEADATDSTKHKCSICNGTEEHSFAYEFVENGNAIKATCSECGATYTVKLTQPAATSDEKIVYDGTEKKAGTAIDSGNTGIETIPENAITYAVVTNGTPSTYSTAAPKNAGTYKAKLTLGTGDNRVSIEINFTIEKAASPTIAGEEKSYAYSVGSDGKTIGVDIAGKLPTDRGTTTYAVAKTDTEQLLSEVAVDTAGNLTYKVNQVDSTKVGKTAIITVTASMENYENVGYTLTISITDKKTVEIKRGNTVSVEGSNVLIYGEKISKLTLGNTVFVEAGTDNMVEGILSWSNPDEIPAAGTTQAGWVFKPTDSRHYVELTGTAAITVVRATPAVVTVPTVAEREYNPAVALADSDMTGGSVTGADGSSLAGTWSFTGTNIIPTVNNKGYQAVFTPDDADNYNTVTRTITVKVTKATPVIAEKPTASVLTYGQTLSDSTLTGGKAAYQTADGTEITGTFAWKNSSSKPTVADSQKTEYDVTFTPSDKDNYNAVDTKLALTVNKAASVALSGESRSYIYAKGSNDKAETMDVAGKLPADRGTTTYAVATTDTEQLLSEVTVDTAGNLTYKVNQVDSSKVGKTAIITVTASMENYENVGYTLTISITDKKTVEIKRGNTVSVEGSNVLIYGEKISKLTLGNTVFVEAGTDNMVEGILSWSNPDEIPAAGTTQAGWVFKPTDSRHYVELTGTAAITVVRATPAVVTVPTVAEREYNPAVALADSDMTGGSVTGADGSSLAGTWSFTGTNIIPTVNNKGYQAVFTPDDADNYNTVTRTITVKVTKATPVIAEKPTASVLTYGQTLSDSTLTGGKATYKTADGTEVAGTFVWKNGTTKPAVGDSGKTEYDVTFTPSDTANYNAVDTKITITVNKAAQAPNMPETTMTPAHSTKKVGDITLPDGWSWQEADRDTALADGVAVTATVVYTGADKGNYETESVSITITRSECNHTHTEIRNQREATCKEEGYTGDTYCKDCGEKLAAGTTIEKKPHKVGTPATCVSKAVCSVCSKTFGEVDATNHVHTTVKNRKEATCTQTGYEGDTYCTDCNKLLSTGKELAALGHDYKTTVTKQPTTTEEGIRTYTCTRCNSSYTESIAKLPEEKHTHNYTGSITKEATCTEAGVRTYTCSCGDSYTENIPATGHSYVSKVTKAATTTEEGIMTYTCSKCGHSYTQPIAKIKSDDSNKDNGSQNQKPQSGTDNGNQNQKPQPDTDNGKDNGTSIKPYIKDDSGKEGWDVIKPQLEEAKAGDTVTVAMNGTTVVPKDVIDSIKGKDTTLVLDMGNGLSWKIYGKDITDAAGDIDFDVTVGADAGKSIPVDVINNVTGEHSSLNLTLAYDGEFGFTATLTVNMESKNAGLYANLFYYNEQTGELEFISAGQIDPEGNVELVFTHASDYTIVVDAKIMSDNGQTDNKSDETIPAPKTDDSTSKYAWNNTIIIIIGICIILIVFGAVFYVRKKSGSEEE